MTALLELKQRIKNLYSQYEIYILPVLRFVLAMVYFIWINTNMGYMKQIDNIFIVLILALICSILPSGVMIFVGFALMVAHGYALGIEVAGFMLVQRETEKRKPGRELKRNMQMIMSADCPATKEV